MQTAYKDLLSELGAIAARAEILSGGADATTSVFAELAHAVRTLLAEQTEDMPREEFLTVALDGLIRGHYVGAQPSR